MRIINFTIIKLTILLVIGILIQGYCQFELQTIFLLTIILISSIGILMVLLKRRYKYHSIISLFQLLGFILIGIFTAAVQNDFIGENHYKNQIIITTEPQIFHAQFYIKEALKPGLYNDRYLIELEALNDTQCTGKLLINVTRDKHCEILQIGQRFYASLEIRLINKALNPGGFDYAKFMANQLVYGQSTLSIGECLPLNNSHNGILSRIAIFRSKLQNKLEAMPFGENELAIINAILLGQKQDLSSELRSQFTDAGAIHILAVSGLHIGIILLMLQKILDPISYLPNGRILKTGIVILLLWNYAVLAGLSASIVRATTMFTIIAIAMNLKRPTNTVNTIFNSIFFILIIQPNFFYDVGFQLSYAAVFGIVFIEPVFRALWSPKVKIVRFFWQILTVSLAAQIGVLPLSLYYFHQFPALFFLTNLIIIPCLGAILGTGFVLLIFIQLNLFPSTLVSIYQFILKSMNQFIQWVASHEEFVIKDIPFSRIEIIIYYFLLVGLVWFVRSKSHKSIVSILSIILVLQSYSLYRKKIRTDIEFIIFHKSRETILTHNYYNAIEVHHSMKSKQIEEELAIKDFLIEERISQSTYTPIQNIYQLNGKYLLVIDSLGVYNITGLKPHMILLRNSPKINLNRLIEHLNPEIIIADGSNYRSFQNNWQITCEVKKIPFHRTSEKGAFIYRY